MNEIELAQFCEMALAHVEGTYPWMWQHKHADGTVCVEKRLVYEVHPDDWTAAEVATFNATVQARVGDVVLMIRDAATAEAGVVFASLWTEPGLYPPGCPGRRMVGSSP